MFKGIGHPKLKKKSVIVPKHLLVYLFYAITGNGYWSYRALKYAEAPQRYPKYVSYATLLKKKNPYCLLFLIELNSRTSSVWFINKSFRLIYWTGSTNPWQILFINQNELVLEFSSVILWIFSSLSVDNNIFSLSYTKAIIWLRTDHF